MTLNNTPHIILITSFILCIGATEFIPRYILPALPSLYLLGSLGLSRVNPKVSFPLTVLVFSLLIHGIWFGGHPASGYDDNLQFIRFIQNCRRTENYIRKNIPPDADIFTEWPINFILKNPDAGYLTGPPVTTLSIHAGAKKINEIWDDFIDKMKATISERPRIWIILHHLGPFTTSMNNFVDKNNLPIEHTTGNPPFHIEIRNLFTPPEFPPELPNK